ncbi:IclR family transcriptional regulator [Arthrobacter sp. S1_S22]|nr:IclR family transcriptional regulator [Arthrobacter sp. S1_S22]
MMTAVLEEQHDLRDRPGADVSKSEQQGTASVLKALQLLDVFRDGGPVLGVSEIARRVGVPTSTAFRLLAYLVEGEFITKEGTRYRLGDKLFELGNQVSLCRPKGLRDLAAPHLGELYAATGMTVRLAVLEGAEIVIVDKIVGLRTVPALTAIGGRVPATCTALGKVMLAFQPAENVARVLQAPLPRLTRYSASQPRLLHKQLIDIRSSRLGYDLEESVLGQVCVAAPIVGGDVAVAAISLSARTHQTNLTQSTAALQQAAVRISALLDAQ